MRAQSPVYFITLFVFLVLASPVGADTSASQPDTAKPKAALIQPFVVEDSFIRELHSGSNGVNYKLYIRLPDGYEEGEERYPVVFLLDADYSFLLARGITEHLSARGHMKKTILVGVAYAGPLNYRLNRTRDYTPAICPHWRLRPGVPEGVRRREMAFSTFFKKISSLGWNGSIESKKEIALWWGIPSADFLPPMLCSVDPAFFRNSSSSAHRCGTTMG